MTNPDPIVPAEQSRESGSKPSLSRWRRLSILLGEGVALVLILMIIAGAYLSLRLMSGPVSFDGLNRIVVELMEGAFDNSFRVGVGNAQITKTEDGIKLSVRDVQISDLQNQQILSIPETLLTLDGLSLLSLNPRPRNIDFIGLSLSLTLYKHGKVALSFMQTDEDKETGETLAPDPDPAEPHSPLDLASLIDAIFDSNSLFGSLQMVHLQNGTIRIEDKRSNHNLIYTQTDLRFDLTQTGVTAISLSAISPKGPWSATAQLRGHHGQDRQLAVSFQDLAISEILGFAEPGLLPVSTDMPLTFDVGLNINPKGEITTLSGDIKGGKARLVIHDPDASPIEISELKGKFRKSENGEALVLSDLLLQGDAMRWQGQGQIMFPTSANEPWRYSFAGDQSRLSLTQLKDHVIKIDEWSVKGELGARFDYISFQPILVKGPETNIRIGGTLGHHSDLEGLSLTIRATNMQARDILAFWPSFVASGTRNYLIRRLHSGQVPAFDLDIQFDPNHLKAAFNSEPIPADTMLIKASVTDAQLQADEGLPLLTHLNGVVRVTGKDARVQIDKGELYSKRTHKLLLADATYTLSDTSISPPMAQVAFKLKGPLDALIEALQSPSLSHLAHVDFTPDQMHGQVEINTNIIWPQTSKPVASDIAVTAQGGFSSFAIDRIFGKERLESGEIKLNLDSKGLTLKGDGKIAGAPTQIFYFHKSGSSKPQIQLQMIMDDQARSKLGLKWGTQLQGPMTTKITLAPDINLTGALIDADLTKTTINGLLPGWQKPASSAARLTLRVNPQADGSYHLKDINLDGGAPVQLRGEAEIHQDGHITQGRFPVFRISANDDMRVELDRVGQITKIQVRANQLDLRPYLKQELSASSGSQSNIVDVDIDLKSASLTGYLNQSMQQADLRLSNRNGEIRDFRLSAKFEQQLISGQLGKGEGGQPALLIESGNAGDLLRFLDLYRRMQGGRILLQIAPSGEQRAGIIVVNDFILKDDPALAGVSQIKYPSLQQPLESGSVNFTKLRAQFTLGGGRFKLDDAVMWGPSIGGSLEGMIDYGADKSDLTGVFVPLYGLNNMLTQIPVLGPLLLGGTGGGIFGINFRVSGSAANPTVTINPLSAVAPGIFRKLFLFGVGKPLGTTDDKPVPPASVPPSQKSNTQ